MATTIFLVNPQTFPSSTTYLLDTYSAAAAYSLRQLKTGVTNVVRVRRSGDNAESDFTATDITDGSLASWVVAGGGTQNGYTVTWYDQSGGGNDVTQATAGSQPQLVSSGVVITKDGDSSILFDGTNDSLVKTTQVINSVSISSFSVCSQAASSVGAIISTDSTSDFCINQFNDARTTPNRHIIVTNTTPTNYFADLSIARNNSDTKLLTFFIDSSNNISAFDNASTGGTDTYTGTVNNTRLNIGKRASGTLHLNGYLKELILFNTDESSNRTDIESDINTYYSIY